MNKEEIFTDEKEIARLKIQSRLLNPYETPVIEKALAGKSGLRILDLGCNDGTKTVERFADKDCERVIGLECNESVVKTAQKYHGSDVFSFHVARLESPEFLTQLSTIVGEGNGFDVIFLSFVLMHLHDPETLLRRLHGLLREGGSLIIIEPNDGNSLLRPDPEGRLGRFLDILARDPYAGNRALGGELTELLDRSGWTDRRIACEAVAATPGDDVEKKEDIFMTFFSYLEDDLAILAGEGALTPELENGQVWLAENIDALHAAVTDPKSTVSMGYRIVVCGEVRV